VGFDFTSGRETELTDFPSPNERWQRFIAAEDLTAEQAGHFLTPANRQQGKIPRYYQEIAINRAIDPLVVHRGTPPPTASVRRATESPSEGNPEMNDLRDLLRHLECVCGYLFGVEYIDWRCPTWEWIPESEEEKNSLMWTKMDVHDVTRVEPTEVIPDELIRVVENRAATSHLDIPLAFYREGKADYREDRYVTAFFSFYFFIEGLYGNGKSGEKKIVREFLASSELVTATESALVHGHDKVSACGHLKVSTPHAI
jgi:hypothetical protein